MVFVIEGMRLDHSLWCRRIRNLFKRRQLTVQLRDRLFPHLAETRVGGCPQLLREALPGKKQALAFPVTLLLVERDRCAGGSPLLRLLLLLLFYGLTLPAACHSISQYRAGMAAVKATFLTMPVVSSTLGAR